MNPSIIFPRYDLYLTNNDNGDDDVAFSSDLQFDDIHKIFLLSKLSFCLFESLYKFLTNALSKIQNLSLNLKIMSHMWLSYPTFHFLFRETSIISNVSKLVYFW